MGDPEALAEPMAALMGLLCGE